jgi:hypothetical protein
MADNVSHETRVKLLDMAVEMLVTYVPEDVSVSELLR